MSGHEVAITWHGHPARAWMPDAIADGSLDLPVDVVRATERAAAGVRRVGDRLPAGWEPLARLLLRAEGIASSNIEGLRAPVVQIAAAEAGAGTVPANAAWVADNLAVVDDALRVARTKAPLRLKDLHRWQRRLMHHADVPARLIGALRNDQSWIGGRGPQDAAYVPPPPDAVPALVDDLVAFVNRADVDAVTQAAVSHAQFETIHPYGDGNGRIGRLLVLWVLARRIGVAVPPPTSVLVARDPGGYLAGLYWFRTDETARWVGWFAHVVESAADASFAWAAEVDEVLATWNERLVGVRADATARRVLEILPTHPVLSVGTTAAELSVSTSTAHAALIELEDRKILTRHQVPNTGPGRPRQWWLAHDLADLVGGWAGAPRAA